MIGDYWIQTFTGRRVSLACPSPDDICVEDIAHALSMQCRFNGHCTCFYSVAQHSVMVANACPPSLKMAGLLHDAAEAYMGDVVRPLKELLARRTRELSLIENGLMTAIRLALAPQIHIYSQEVTTADLVALATEKRDLLACDVRWDMQLPDAEELRISALFPDAAEQLFLDKFYELK